MEEMNKKNLSRRGFLKTAALAGAALAMPGGLDNVLRPERNNNQKHPAKIPMPHILRAIAYWVPARRSSRSQPLASV